MFMESKRIYNRNRLKFHPVTITLAIENQSHVVDGRPQGWRLIAPSPPTIRVSVGSAAILLLLPVFLHFSSANPAVRL